MKRCNVCLGWSAQAAEGGGQVRRRGQGRG